jgi:hypothetical protein
MTYIPSEPQSGAMYHRLTTLIAANYSGLGPNNVSSNPYRSMVGQPFQKPLSASGAVPPLLHDRTHTPHTLVKL